MTTLYEKLNFDLVRDIAAVSGVTRAPLVVEVSPSFAARTVPELIANAKTNPGKINIATAGTASVSHLIVELLKMRAGIDIVRVPYPSAASAIPDVLADRVHAVVDPIVSSIEHIRAGRLRDVMKLPRRNFLQLAAGAATLSAISRVAWAQAYPTRPVRVIVPFAPGGNSDITARLLGQWLSERLGQQFVIDNRPGGGGNIGTEAVVRSSPDGYTLLLVGGWNAINTTFYDKLSFNFIRDIAPVASIIVVPNVMVVNPSVPAKTVPEFIAYAKTTPSKINYASAGTGAPSHVTGELFKMMAGVDMVHVPYRSAGLALTDLLGGQAQIIFPTTVASIEYIRAGRLRALAVTAATRSEALPQIPTVSEFVPGFEATGWYGVGAPKNTPAEIIDRLNKEINAGLADPKIKARLADLGGDVLAVSPGDFGRLIADETEKWGKVIRAANIKAD